jgi:flagellin-like hook-associated protein FlgL
MPIRISENYLGQVLVGDLNRSLGRMLQLQRQAGSMRRINSFADDPRGVGNIQRYTGLIASNDQYLRNLSRSQVLVESSDTALQDISSLLGDVRELVLRESNASATPASRQSAAFEIDSMVNHLLDVLNTSVEGNYIFSGYRTTTPPFVRNGDTVVYQGDDGVIHAQSGPKGSIPVTIPGSVFMGTHSAVLAGTADLAPRLDLTTDLDDINLGRGWEPGTIEITDGAGGSYQVNLGSATTIGDVIAAINTATSGAVTASLAADGTGLNLAGNGPLTVSDVGGGQAATGLGINATSAAGLLAGRDIRPPVDATSLLADIPALAGHLPLGSMEVEVAGTVYAVDLSTATTLGDAKSLFEAAVPGHELRIDTSGLSVVSGSTTAFIVRNAGTPETATLLGLEGTGTPVRLFGMFEDLKAHLLAGDVEAIRGALTEAAALESMIHVQMVKVGGRQSDMDWADAILRQRDEQLQAKLSLERDADVAQVSSDLSQAEMSYQSSLLVTSRLFQTNLMMYL